MASGAADGDFDGGGQGSSVGWGFRSRRKNRFSHPVASGYFCFTSRRPKWLRGRDWTLLENRFFCRRGRKLRSAASKFSVYDKMLRIRATGRCAAEDRRFLHPIDFAGRTNRLGETVLRCEIGGGFFRAHAGHRFRFTSGWAKTILRETGPMADHPLGRHRHEKRRLSLAAKVGDRPKAVTASHAQRVYGCCYSNVLAYLGAKAQPSCAAGGPCATVRCFKLDHSGSIGICFE